MFVFGFSLSFYIFQSIYIVILILSPVGIWSCVDTYSKGHTISFHRGTIGSPNHSLFSGPNRRSVRMACFMKKMRYMEKNMRDGHAWSGSEVNENVSNCEQKMIFFPFSRSRPSLTNTIGKRSCLDQRLILYKRYESDILYAEWLLLM